MIEPALFVAAIAFVDPQERATVLDRECTARPELRRWLDALLAAHFQSNQLPDTPTEVQITYHTASGESAMITPSAAEAIGTIIAGRYQFLEKIGEGGGGGWTTSTPSCVPNDE